MPVAYSTDLRWRAVWLYLVRRMSPSEIADVLFMAERSVYRYIELFNSTGDVAPELYKRGPKKTLSDFEQFCILQALIHHPKLYLSELQQLLHDSTGTSVSKSTICRTVKQHGWTRKRAQHIALQRSEEKRISFMAEVSAFDPSMLVWIDETGSDRRNEIRKYGYSLRGTRACDYQLRVGGKHISAIPVMTTNGIEDVFVTTGSVNGDTFVQFICECVLPILLPFNGINSHSIVIIDNASIHHVERVYDIITGVGARLMFLPPYSPDLMPLEEVFAQVKSFLKSNESINISTSTPELFLKLAFSTVSKDDCQGYIRHAGYDHI